MKSAVNQKLALIAEDKSLNKAPVDCLPYPVMLISRDRIILSANKFALRIGVTVGSYCWETFGKLAFLPEADRKYFKKHGKAPEGGTKCIFCQADKALSSYKPINKHITAENTVRDTSWIPVSDDVYIHYAIDITAE